MDYRAGKKTNEYLLTIVRDSNLMRVQAHVIGVKGKGYEENNRGEIEMAI